MIDPGLAGKVALVTGANHGIGAATARALARQGVAVFLTYLRRFSDAFDEELAGDADQPGRPRYRRLQLQDADHVVAAIHADGGRAEASEGDLSLPASIPRLFDRAEQVLGPVDILVNNAAYCDADTFLPGGPPPNEGRTGVLDAETIDRHHAVNVRAPSLLIAEYARRLALRDARWGRVIGVSTDGASAFPGEVSYGASKHAMESYHRAAAAELGPRGITVNVVSLAAVQTGWVSPRIEARAIPTIPLGRIGQPEDVADVILFLASEQARWVTGQLLYVGGGHVMPL